jgi:hypothetical protein
VNAEQRTALIARYRAGVAEVRAALEAIGPETLDLRPADGGWSARRVVHHLADSEMTSAIRLRRLLAEERPDIGAYDEEAFADRLHYDTRDVAPSLKAFEAARETTAQVLDHLNDDDWHREGTHS